MLPDLRLKTINVSSFSPFGILKAVNLDIDPLTGRHKGYAYVEYDLPEGSQARIYFFLQSTYKCYSRGFPTRIWLVTSFQPHSELSFARCAQETP